MPSTTGYRRGDIVLVPFPFTDLTGSKRRPALVLSPDAFNLHQQDLVLAAVTSQVTDPEQRFVLNAQDLVDGTLPSVSVIKPTKLFTIHTTLIIRKLAGLRPEKLAEVLAALRAFFA